MALLTFLVRLFNICIVKNVMNTLCKTKFPYPVHGFNRCWMGSVATHWAYTWKEIFYAILIDPCCQKKINICLFQLFKQCQCRSYWHNYTTLKWFPYQSSITQRKEHVGNKFFHIVQCLELQIFIYTWTLVLINTTKMK